MDLFARAMKEVGKTNPSIAVLGDAVCALLVTDKCLHTIYNAILVASRLMNSITAQVFRSVAKEMTENIWTQ